MAATLIRTVFAHTLVSTIFRIQVGSFAFLFERLVSVIEEPNVTDHKAFERILVTIYICIFER